MNGGRDEKRNGKEEMKREWGKMEGERGSYSGWGYGGRGVVRKDR